MNLQSPRHPLPLYHLYLSTVLMARADKGSVVRVLSSAASNAWDKDRHRWGHTVNRTTRSKTLCSSASERAVASPEYLPEMPRAPVSVSTRASPMAVTWLTLPPPSCATIASKAGSNWLAQGNIQHGRGRTPRNEWCNSDTDEGNAQQQRRKTHAHLGVDSEHGHAEKGGCDFRHAAVSAVHRDTRRVQGPRAIAWLASPHTQQP
jgi:hypothetical protein